MTDSYENTMNKESRMDFISAVTLILSCSAFVIAIVAYHRVTMIDEENKSVEETHRGNEASSTMMIRDVRDVDAAFQDAIQGLKVRQ